MESIKYNGISLDVVRAIKCSRKAVLDAVNNLLYWRWEIDAECHYQPTKVSYVADANGNPLPQPGQLPGATDLAILKTLLTPRGVLIVQAGGATILETPPLLAGKVRAPCDAANGPFVEFVDTPKQIGTRHWFVHIRFVAHENSCTTTNPVLSNTWVQTEDIDELHYPRRFVAGEAILRTDQMRAQHLNADAFRGSFFFPVPLNYVRENIRVTLSEDGSRLSWSFEDVLRCYNVKEESPIRKFDIWRTFYSTIGGRGRANAQIAQQAEIELAQAAAWGLAAGPLAELGIFASIGLSLLGMVRPTLMTVVNNLPQFRLNVRCDLWGARTAARSDLTRIAMGICLNQFTDSVPAQIVDLGQHEIIIRQNIGDEFVSCEMTYAWGTDVGRALASLAVPNNGPPVVMHQTASDGSVVMAAAFDSDNSLYGRDLDGNNRQEVLFKRDGRNPTPSSNAFGSQIEIFVVQALTSPCQTPTNAASLVLRS